MLIDNSETFPRFVKSRNVDPSTVSVVFDIGSRDASQAVELSTLFSRAKVFAIECNPATLARCRANIASHDRITLIEKAINSFTGRCKFFPTDPDKTVTPWPEGNPGASSLFLATADYPHETYVQHEIEVACTRLDDLCRDYGIDAIDVIWMDLQGAELIALQSAGDLLDGVRYIHVEVSFKPLYVEQALFDDVDRFLRTKGFRLCSMIDPTAWQQNVIYENGRHLRRPRAKKTIFDPGKAVIIHQPWGGLGDNLQFSTLPERFAELDIQVFISTSNVLRNPEIHELVWGCNPYVAGVSDQPPNAGAVRGAITSKLPLSIPFVERIEAAHGFEPRNRLPKIYYHPSPLPAMSDTILIDLSSTSVVPARDKLQQYVGYILERFGYARADCRTVTFRNPVARNQPG